MEREELRARLETETIEESVRRYFVWNKLVLAFARRPDVPEELQEYPVQIEERFVLYNKTLKKPDNTDFFNHSCDPNAGVNGQIFLVAVRDINKGEEITFDYAMTISESVGSNIVFEMDCNCGYENCRKKITENDWKLPELRERYAGYFSQYIQDMIDKEE